VFISLRLFVISTDINKTYDDFMDKLTKAINEVAPIKNVRVKGSNQDWFDNQIHDAIKKEISFFVISKKQNFMMIVLNIQRHGTMSNA